MSGVVIGIFAIALCVLITGVGSGVGLYFTGQAASGVIAEDGKKYSKVLVMVVFPATQGIYGFVIAIVAQGYLGSLETLAQAWILFAAVMQFALTGFLAGLFQAKTAVASIYAVARNEKLSGKLILFPAMIETYMILSLVMTILLLGVI